VLKTLDRYILREVLPPFGLALLVFTFLLTIDPIMRYAEPLLARGVAFIDVARIILTLVPQALGIAIPVAFLVGLLIAFGRLSGDREMVAMLAGGVSLYRLLRPVGLLALAAALATFYVMVVAIPDANQAFRELTYTILAERAEHDIKPRVFFEDFPGKVLYVREASASTRGWRGVFVADTTGPGWPTVYVADRGYLALDRTARRVDLVLERGARHTPEEVLAFGVMTIALDPDTVFPRTGPQRGIQEMTIAALREQIRLKASQHLPVHNEIMAIHLKFSVPVACLVFGTIGLALGVTSRKDGKLAGFVIGLGVVFSYYVILFVAESLTKAQWLPAAWSRWVPNLALGAVGVALLVWRARWTERPVPLRMPTWALARVWDRPRPASRASAGRPRPLVVVRWPRLGLPAPSLLDRYITRRHLGVLALAFAGLLALFYISSFIDLSDELFKGQASAWLLGQYLWYATPQFSYYVLPLSILIATLVTVGLLTKTNELTVIKACGISLYRTALPLLFVGLAGAGLLFALEETILAGANQRADAISRTIRGRPPRTVTAANRTWLAGRHGQIYHYRLFDPDTDRLFMLSVFEFDASGRRLVRQTAVARAAFTHGSWVGEQGWTRRYQDAGDTLEAATEQFTTRRLELDPPEYFETERPSADMMTVAELRRHLQELELSGADVTRYRVDLQRKLAFPFVTVIMTLIAVPFAVTTGRRGALYGVGLGLALAMTYWLLTSLFAAAGTAGLLAPGLAAWAPNLLFGAGALYLILTVRT